VILLVHDGEPLVLEAGKIKTDSPIPLKEMLVDGHSVGDVGERILKERQSLGKEGVLIVLVKGDKVELISKGFVFNERSLFTELESLAQRTMKKSKDPKTLGDNLIASLSGFINTRFERSPEIIPVIV